LIQKIKHYLYKNVFKLLKYDFETFIPNSAGRKKTINKLIKININNSILNLALISDRFQEIEVSHFKELKDLKIDKSFQDNLNKLFSLYGSDKNKHGYDKLYSNILSMISPTPKILEIGMGSVNSNIPSNMGKRGVPGASLRAFADLFPDSQIYGADIDKDILFQENNISTFYLDQNQLSTYDNPIIENKKFDLIIDDGVHMQSANLNSLLFSLERLTNNGVLVVEDIPHSALDTWKIVINLIREPFSMRIIKCIDNYVITVSKNS
tara:strand:- start:1668 stop:2465 length:798 start_codon:yes stop_codon:yes gene_type:complete